MEQAPVQRISNPTAVFSGLDKITGRIITFDVAIDETVQFGALQVTPRACYTRPATEIQNTTAFVEVDEITLAGDIKRIFTGWMFANSPGLNAVEHPIYDVWLKACKQNSKVPMPKGDVAAAKAAAQGAAQEKAAAAPAEQQAGPKAGDELGPSEPAGNGTPDKTGATTPVPPKRPQAQATPPAPR